MFVHHSRVRSWLLILCVILFFVCSPTGFVGYAHASTADDPISINAETYNVHFPASIDFNLNASDTSGQITKATIYLTFNDGRNQQDDVTPATPSSHVALAWHETNFYPQGSLVKYYWVVQDGVGHSYTGPTRQFTIVDTRFTWQTLSQGHVIVHWYTRDQSFGQFVLNQTTRHIARITKKLGGPLNHDINIWIYTTVEDFKGSLEPGAYEWVGGEARPWLNEAAFVVVDASDERLVRDMPHELSHLAFHQLIKNGIAAPAWFDEGLAVDNQLFHEQTMALHFQEALQRHTLLRLYTISDRFPKDAYQADLAYAESWQLVNYMYKTFGQAKMTALIKAMSHLDPNFSNQPFSDYLLKTLGVDQNHLENQWRISLHQSPILNASDTTNTATTPTNTQTPAVQKINDFDSTTITLTVLGVILLLVASGLFIAVIVIRKRQQQKARAIWEAEQILTQPQSSQAPASYPYQEPFQMPQAPKWPIEPPAPQE